MPKASILSAFDVHLAYTSCGKCSPVAGCMSKLSKTAGGPQWHLLDVCVCTVYPQLAMFKPVFVWHPAVGSR